MFEMDTVQLINHEGLDTNKTWDQQHPVRNVEKLMFDYM